MPDAPPSERRLSLRPFEDWVFAMLRIQSPVAREHLRQMLRFGVAGSVGACIDLSTLPLFVEVLGVPEMIAFICSSTLSVMFVFSFNKIVTFRRREVSGTGSQLLKFILVYGFAIALNATISSFFLWLGVHYFLSKVLAIGIGMVLNYTLSHTFIFAQSNA